MINGDIIRFKRRCAGEIKDIVKDIIDVILDDVNRAVANREDECITEIPVDFDIDRLTPSDARRRIYYEILRKLEELKMVPQLKITGKPGHQQAYIITTWILDEDREEEERMKKYIADRLVNKKPPPPVREDKYLLEKYGFLHPTKSTEQANTTPTETIEPVSYGAASTTRTHSVHSTHSKHSEHGPHNLSSRFNKKSKDRKPVEIINGDTDKKPVINPITEKVRGMILQTNKDLKMFDVKEAERWVPKPINKYEKNYKDIGIYPNMSKEVFVTEVDDYDNIVEDTADPPAVVAPVKNPIHHLPANRKTSRSTKLTMPEIAEASRGVTRGSVKKDTPSVDVVPTTIAAPIPHSTFATTKRPTIKPRKYR